MKSDQREMLRYLEESWVAENQGASMPPKVVRAAKRLVSEVDRLVDQVGIGALCFVEGDRLGIVIQESCVSCGGSEAARTDSLTVVQ